MRQATPVFVAVTIALLLLLPSRHAEACGAICEQDSAEYGEDSCPDSLLLGGPVFYIGSADQWNLAEDAGLIYELTQAATADGTGVDLVPLAPEDGDPDTTAAATQLRAAGIRLGAAARMSLSRTTVASVPGFPHIRSWTVTSMEASVGALRFQEFTHRKMHTKYQLCNVGPWLDGSTKAFCQLIGANPGTQLSVWSANPALTFPQSSPIELAGDTPFLFPSPPYDDLGLRFSATTPGTMTWIPGSYGLHPRGFLLFDLEVPDLPQAWKDEYGDTVRVAAHVYGGTIYTSIYVPAMSLRGSSILVIAVLALGLLALIPWPHLGRASRP